MKRNNFICRTDINFKNNNDEDIGFINLNKFSNNNINSINNYISPSQKNNKNCNYNNINKFKINTPLSPYYNISSYTYENPKKSNKVFIPNKKKEINKINNKYIKRKDMFNKVQKEIKIIKMKLTNDILRNKIQLLDNIRTDNNIPFNKNTINNHKNRIILNNAIKQKNMTYNDFNNIFIGNNMRYKNKEQFYKYNNVNMNQNSLKNIYYINNNFRINSIQNNNNENNNNNNLKVPKSDFNININQNNFIKKPSNVNKLINIPNKMRKYISNSPNFFNSKNTFKTIYDYPKNLNIKNIRTKNYLNVTPNNAKNNSQINLNNLPKGYFDDYLTSSNDIETKNNINNRISRVMQSNINDKYNKYTNNPQLNNELKIQNFNNLFINNTKNVKKDFRLQTENKIINITYKGIKIKNSRNIINNEIINTINFSFNPKKINFNNEQKENHKSINKTKNVDNNSKNLISLIDPDALEEKSIILPNDIKEEKEDKKEENIKSKKKISFDDNKIIIKYVQNDYIRNYNLLLKTKIIDKYKNENENNEQKIEYDKIPHKFISTTQLCNLLKKKNNKNLKSILNKNAKKYNPNLALLKLNELIMDDEPINQKDEISNNINNNVNINNNNARYIKKNINFIKKVEECNKKGINYRSLTISKREIKLLKKKKKNICHKFRDNPQNFFSEKLKENVIKSLMNNNLDDSELLKINKSRIINKLGKIKENNDNKDKLNNSFS